MKLELIVEGSQLDSEVKDLLATLTPEQKNKMAEEVLTKTMNSVDSSMKSRIAREKALEDTFAKFPDKKDKLRVNEKGELEHLSYNSWYGADSNVRDYYQHQVRVYGDVGLYFKEHILAAMLEYGKTLIKETVENSQVVKDAIDIAKEEIKAQMPKIIHDAMVVYFSSQMTHMLQGIGQAVFQTGNNQQLLSNIQDKMSRNNIY